MPKLRYLDPRPEIEIIATSEYNRESIEIIDVSQFFIWQEIANDQSSAAMTYADRSPTVSVPTEFYWAMALLTFALVLAGLGLVTDSHVAASLAAFGFAGFFFLAARWLEKAESER